MRLTIISIFILLFFTCKSQHTSNNSNDDIIRNKVIKLKGLEDAMYDRNYVLNNNLLNLLNENIVFENGKYAEFGDLRNVIEDSIIDDVFNEFEFHNLVSQIKRNSQPTRKGNEKIKNTEIHNNINSNKKITFTLSKPIFCIKKPYALIMYSYGSKLYGIGGSGVVLFKKTGNKWVLINEFWGTMS
ncbi:hypothetical protein KO493_02575 [Tamlana agarivorans]|uniref:Uncharacterized protein n=1 Tax=Pseudotamlana agarivorans TaxID=481183 RepID=A0ACC5U5G9_9FLAO|nr:hypothetical protein [Tamlana agarivorans]MBU2949578.1 hypothetical protein [Tamlana agarivorans]